MRVLIFLGFLALTILIPLGLSHAQSELEAQGSPISLLP